MTSGTRATGSSPSGAAPSGRLPTSHAASAPRVSAPIWQMRPSSGSSRCAPLGLYVAAGDMRCTTLLLATCGTPRCFCSLLFTGINTPRQHQPPKSGRHRRSLATARLIASCTLGVSAAEILLECTQLPELVEMSCFRSDTHCSSFILKLLPARVFQTNTVTLRMCGNTRCLCDNTRTTGCRGGSRG